MGERLAYAPGTFCWAELSTPDVTRAAAFYGALFGWSLEAGRFQLGGADVAGVRGGERGWLSYVSVSDADALAARVGPLGGTVRSGPLDVGDPADARVVVVEDPVGALVALREPRGHVGAALVNAPGALTWNDLVTATPEPAERFYADLLGWSFQRVAPEYAGIANAGARNGGVLTPPVETPSFWVPYFAADDLDASLSAVQAAGGSVPAPPRAVPAGRFALVRDPAGAAFSLLEGLLDP